MRDTKETDPSLNWQNLYVKNNNKKKQQKKKKKNKNKYNNNNKNNINRVLWSEVSNIYTHMNILLKDTAGKNKQWINIAI